MTLFGVNWLVPDSGVGNSNAQHTEQKYYSESDFVRSSHLQLPDEGNWKNDKGYLGKYIHYAGSEELPVRKYRASDGRIFRCILWR